MFTGLSVKTFFFFFLRMLFRSTRNVVHFCGTHDRFSIEWFQHLKCDDDDPSTVPTTVYAMNANLYTL